MTDYKGLCKKREKIKQILISCRYSVVVPVFIKLKLD